MGISALQGVILVLRRSSTELQAALRAVPALVVAPAVRFECSHWTAVRFPTSKSDNSSCGAAPRVPERCDASRAQAFLGKGSSTSASGAILRTTGRTTSGYAAPGDSHQAGPLWQPAGCDVGLEFKLEWPRFDIAARHLRHVSVNPVTHLRIAKTSRRMRGHSPGRKREHDPCLNFSAQASRPHFYRSF